MQGYAAQVLRLPLAAFYKWQAGQVRPGLYLTLSRGITFILALKPHPEISRDIEGFFKKYRDICSHRPLSPDDFIEHCRLYTNITGKFFLTNIHCF